MTSPRVMPQLPMRDRHADLAAVEWFNNKDFHGYNTGVSIAQSKSKDYTVCNSVGDPNDLGGFEENAMDLNEGGGRGRGQGDASGKAWQHDGDWFCPNTSCSNVILHFVVCATVVQVLDLLVHLAVVLEL
ncbi:hypothetical protein OIU84_020943 [Salix udensis]|uniref:Uncharacterized protein n=1 Tax=Salix udensis TaxID=889485 RepID=A0AAD6PGZ5_9ROSI|nr:hypothetical protein OIU84_020943 [Salix udensis]